MWQPQSYTSVYRVSFWTVCTSMVCLVKKQSKASTVSQNSRSTKVVFFFLFAHFIHFLFVWMSSAVVVLLLFLFLYTRCDFSSFCFCWSSLNISRVKQLRKQNPKNNLSFWTLTGFCCCFFVFLVIGLRIFPVKNIFHRSFSYRDNSYENNMESFLDYSSLCLFLTS